MADKPITRSERALDGEGDAPLTRQEQIIAGKNVTPVTRFERFLKKFVDEGGGTQPTGTISITENGTYDVTDYAEANVNTDPAKGYVLYDYDEDGFPTKAKFVGNWQSTPINFSSSDSNFSKLTQRITNIEFVDTITEIGYASFQNYLALSTVEIPSTSIKINGAAFRGCENVTEILISGDLALGGSPFRECTKIERFIVGGKIAVNGWGNPFFINSADYESLIPVELYDFSGCNGPFGLGATYYLPRKSGCVIRVKQGTLATWQNDTNWNILPTDPNVSGYVVWQEV